jgi:hypothetical protein
MADKTAGRPKRKLSRFGCASCKKLRIKCDESKPTCEYCAATNRTCIYLSSGTRDPTPLYQFEKEHVTALSPWRANQNPWNGLSSLSRLSGVQVHAMEYFVAFGAFMVTLGDPVMADMWRTNGVQVAMQSDAVLNGVMAVTTYIMSRRKLLANKTLPGEYFQNALTIFRSEIARDKRYHCPEELALAATLISAMAMSDVELVPVVSYTGGVDLLGIFQGTTAVFETYHRSLNRSFTKVLGRHITDVVVYSDIPVMDMISYLAEKLEDYFLFGGEEVDEYYKTILYLNKVCHHARTVGYMFPLVALLGRVSSQFHAYVREMRPFAVIILSFISAIYRSTMFSFRPDFDMWDEFIANAYTIVPPEMHDMLDLAVQVSRGLAFTQDIHPLSRLSRGV